LHQTHKQLKEFRRQRFCFGYKKVAFVKPQKLIYNRNLGRHRM